MNLFRYLSGMSRKSMFCCIGSLYCGKFIVKLCLLGLSLLRLHETPSIRNLSLLVNVDIVDFDSETILIFLDKLTDVDDVEASQVFSHDVADRLLNTLLIAPSNQQFPVVFGPRLDMNLHG